MTKADLQRLRRLAVEEINRLLHWTRIKQPDDSHLRASDEVALWEECLARLDEDILSLEET
jgi:hypothetical protein